jgi:hypothetical protein
MLAALGVVLMAAAAGMWPAAGAGSRSEFLPTPNASRFDRFIYLRHNEVNGAALTDSLILVSLTNGGFEARPVYSQKNLFISWTPLCVRGGKLYAVKLDKLISIDLVTRNAEQMEGNLESFTFEGGRLYAMVSQPSGEDWWLRVYDFDTRSYRNIATTKPVRIQLSGGNPAQPPRLSPEKKWLAYFSPCCWSNNFVLKFQLQLVSVDSGAARTCGDSLPAREWGTGAGSVSVGPPFTWLTPKIILVVRDDSKQLYSEMGMRRSPSGFGTLDGSAVEMSLAALDIDSGRMTNLMRLPTFQPGIGEPWFPPADEHGAPRIVLGELGQYRIDLTAGRVTKDDGLRGPYRYRRADGLSELLVGAKQLDGGEAMPEVAVSPDGQSIAWEVHALESPLGQTPCSLIRFQTAQANEPQTVATEWIPEVYRTGHGHSLEGNLLWISSSDLAPRPAEPPASGWTAFPLAK